MTRALAVSTALALLLAGCDREADLDAEATRQLEDAMATEARLTANGLSRYDRNDIELLTPVPKRFGREYVSCARATPLAADGSPSGPARRAFVVGGAPAFDGPKAGPWFAHLWRKLDCPA